MSMNKRFLNGDEWDYFEYLKPLIPIPDDILDQPQFIFFQYSKIISENLMEPRRYRIPPCNTCKQFCRNTPFELKLDTLNFILI